MLSESPNGIFTIKSTKMQRFFRMLYVIMSMICGVISMQGGGDYKPDDFAFTALIITGNPKKTVCMGVLDSESTFITASKCLKRVDPDKETTQFVASIFSPTQEIPIMMVEPGKLGDAPEEGISPFPDHATVIAKAKPPGVLVKAKDDIGRTGGPGPTYTPWPEYEDDIVLRTNITSAQVTGIVAGMNNKAATVKVLTDDECHTRLRSKIPEDLIAFNNENLDTNFTARDYFCTIKGEEGGQFPAGYPCEEDLGAPFIFKGKVWGILMGAWCVDDSSQTALFRGSARSWDYRRFDGSLTDPPPTTKGPDWNTTEYHRDDTTRGRAARKYLLRPIYILMIVAASKMNLFSE